MLNHDEWQTESIHNTKTIVWVYLEQGLPIPDKHAVLGFLN